ncbi:MAG: hypothetical protein JNK04_23500, partial [Myxococcales bacterium]|nr:hypothetical protein [Myxococcales bacterium]
MSNTSEANAKKTRAPKKRRSWPRRILRGVLFLALFVVLLVAGAVGYLHTDSGKERVRALVVKRLGDRVNGTVELEGIDYALGGAITLRGLRIKDQTGEAAIALDSVRLAPRWGALRESITLDEATIKGLHVTIVKDAEGGSNLKSLFKPRESSGEPSKPLSKVINLEKLAIEDVSVTIVSPDGTKLAVHDIAISGHVTALPSEKNVDIDLDPISLGLDLKKAPASGGLTLGVQNLKTGLAVALTGGKGTLKLKPLSADLALLVPATTKEGAVDPSLPPKIDKTFPIGFDGIELDVAEGDLGVSLEKLALGAVSLASVDLKANLVDGSLSGAPAADVVGLHVDAKQVNSLLGKELLLSDVDLEAHLKGKSTSPELGVLLATKGGRITLDAKIDTTDAAAPTHAVTLALENIDTDKLLSPSLAIPKVEVASLKLTANGKGKDLASLSTAGTLELRDVTAKGVKVDSVSTKLSFQGDAIRFDDLEVAAIDQHLSASGTFDRGTKKVSAKLSLDGDVGVALAKLKAAGLPITTKLEKGLVRLPKDDLAITVDGTVGGSLDVTAKTKKLSALGGTLKLDAKVALEKGNPEKGEKSLKLKTFDALVDLDGLMLSRILALRGKAIDPRLGVDGAINVHLAAKGTLAEPEVDLRTSIVELRKDGGARARADITGKIANQTARLNLAVKNVANPEDVILALNADLPLLLSGEKKGLDPSRSLDVRLDMKRRPVASLVAFVPPILLGGKAIPKADLSLAASLRGAVARPTARVELEALGVFLSPDAPTSPKQKVRLDVALDPQEKSTTHKATGTLAVAIDDTKAPLVSGRFGATFPYSPLVAGATAQTKFDAHIDIAAVLGDLPDVIELARARAIGGKVAGTIDLRGDPRDITAEVRLAANDLKPDGNGPLDANVKVDLLADKTTVDVGIDLAKSRLLSLTGPVGLAGKGLFAKAKAGLDPTLDLTLDIPTRKLSSLAVLRPKLEKAPGNLSGSIKVSGSAKAPMAGGAIAVSDVTTWSGKVAGAGVDLKLDDKALVATIGVGAVKASDAPVTIVATIQRAELDEFRRKADEKAPSVDKTLAIDVKASSNKTPIMDLVPKSLVENVTVEPKGALDWNMGAKITLEKKGDKTAVKSARLDGPLKITGNIPLPNSKRVYEDVDVSISAAGETITIERVAAKESDVEVKNRSFSLSGTLVLEKLKAKQLDVALKSDRWLLFGSKTIGLVDAPRGTLTIDAKARGELDRPIKNVTVDIDKLEVAFPDRFEKAHQPEDVHAGDVVFLGKDQPAIGQLPLPESVKAKLAAKLEAQKQIQLGGATLPTPPPDATPPQEEGADIDIHIAKGARLFQSPIDLKPSGNISIAIRPTGRTIRGKLEMHSGELSLGGKMHPLKRGSLAFDANHPQGFIDLEFEKPLAPWQLRNISEASAKKAI